MSNDRCLNKSIGGSSGFYVHEITEDQREKISVSVKKFRKENSQIIKEAASKRSKKFWDNITPDQLKNIRKHRKNQINPMKGKKQKRICCLKCKLETSVNAFGRHKKYCYK